MTVISTDTDPLPVRITNKSRHPLPSYATAHSAGVISFTRLSVHWADRSTATSSVYGSRWSSGIGVSGYNSARRRRM